MRPIITLTTDFGLRDSYVAEMKAVILSICPDVILVDITHDVPDYDIRAASYLLSRAVDYFPRGTIHLTVVDPGVGSERNPIIVETKRAVFVGPDNGVVLLAAEKLGLKSVYKIEPSNLMIPRSCKTFHGRDIFAPIAGYLALGVTLSSLGSEVSEYVKLAYLTPTIDKNTIEAEILYIDHFGNIVTNVKSEILKNKSVKFGQVYKITIGSIHVAVKFLEAYSKALEGELLVTVGSGGLVEIAANRNNAAKALNAKPGMKVLFTL